MSKPIFYTTKRLRVWPWLVLLIIGLGGYLAFPSSLEPEIWTPPLDKGLVGDFETNNALLSAAQTKMTLGSGPEDIALLPDGSYYTGLHNGVIAHVLPNGEQREFANTGGRPLGLAFDAAGNLIIADSVRGLLSIDPAGEVKTLATEADGVRFGFADDVDVAPDGKIYFSDASFAYGFDDIDNDMFEARANGRLVVYDPATGKASALLDDLYFANGVAVSPDNDFVLVTETFRYRLTKYWIEGPRVGTSEVIMDNLPGFPDGISSNGAGAFWMPLFTTRSGLLDKAHADPFLKHLLMKIPKFLTPRPEPVGIVIKLDSSGNVLATYQDQSGAKVLTASSVEEVEGTLWIGSPEASHVAIYKVPHP